MARLSIYKETTVPGTMQAHSIYIVAPESKPGFVEVYVTDATAAARKVIDEERVLELISEYVAAANAIQVVADIDERDALEPEENILVLVLDASDDSTVASGAATYVYRVSTDSWIKIAEHESLDLTLSWSALSGKPSSSPADIDDAVTKRHSHSNITSLDKIGESGGNMTYNGSLPATGWASINW